jgi:hypothetical protein
MWNSFIALILVLACNLTDANFFGAKVSELLVLALLPFATYSAFRLSRPVGMMFAIFTVFLLSTFISNVGMQFYRPANEISALKAPYIISIARYVELLLCTIVFAFVTGSISRDKLQTVLQRFFSYNTIFTVAVLLIFAVDFVIGSSIVTEEGGHRLKGFFVEGGPYGLFCSAILAIAHSFKMLKKSAILVIGGALALSQSKAGILLTVVYYGVLPLTKLKLKSILPAILMLSVLGTLSWMTLGERFVGYFNAVSTVEELLSVRSDDPSVIMGRIAGAYIAPQMIQANPILGVGLGNYSLVRNNPAYRGIFPAVDDWDLTGLGLLTLIAESGIFGSALFLWLYLTIVFSISRATALRLPAFIPLFCFALGLQIYFIYPWILLSLCLALSQSRKNEMAFVRREN